MADGKFGMKVSVILFILLAIVIIAIYGGLRLSQANGAITGTVGLGENAITGFSTYNCEYITGGIRCGSEVYVMKTQEVCPNGTVLTCTNICELDRMTAGDDRVCPAYCSEYCLSPDVVQKLNK